jgi:hypothetical protein
MKNFCLICLIAVFIFACTANNEEDLMLIEAQEIQVTNTEDYVEENIVPTVPLADDTCDCSESEVFNPTFTGTACCIERITVLSLEEPIRYWYATNLDNPSVHWEVLSGEIEIIAGQESSIVTIKLGDGFDGGMIRGLGTSSPTGLQCSNLVLIEKLEE